MNVSKDRECDGCGRDQSTEHFRCAVCRGLFCEDCTNHPADDEGPCVECEANAPRVVPIAYAPMDNGTLTVRRIPLPPEFYDLADAALIGRG